MKNISIIIPVYNVESYLEECLSSVCEQGIVVQLSRQKSKLFIMN